MTSRRGFLASLAGAAAIALDPERALWVPGAKLISIPAAPVMVTAGWAESVTFAVGDIVTIAGRFMVNPITREETALLQRFQVLADGGLRPFHEMPVGRLPRLTADAWQSAYNAAARRGL